MGLLDGKKAVIFGVANDRSIAWVPGGGKLGAYLHQCRTVCRRAEREILRLSRVEELSEWPVKYVNRLSDLFFVLSRWISKQTGEEEYLWQRGLAERPQAKK